MDQAGQLVNPDKRDHLEMYGETCHINACCAMRSHMHVVVIRCWKTMQTDLASTYPIARSCKSSVLPFTLDDTQRLYSATQSHLL